MKSIRSILTIGATLFVIGASPAKAEKDIVDTAVAAGDFKTLATALKAAGLVETLKGKGPFTVFAPTDAAFAKLPKGTVETLLKPENKDQLTDILTYHVVAGEVPAKVAVTLKKATPLNKKDIMLKVENGELFLNKSKVVKSDIKCSNGIIHVIDAVLLPPAKNKQAGAKRKMMELLQTAIQHGARQYNHGNHQACAAIYQVAAKALMQMPEVSASEQKMLTNVMNSANHSHCATTNAWTFRKAFDRMLASN